MTDASALNGALPMTIADLLDRQAADHPEHFHLFLPDGENERERLPYPELRARCVALAAALRHRVEDGGRVLIILPPGIEYSLAILACATAGVVAVPVYPPDPAAPAAGLLAIAGVIASSDPALLLTCAPLHGLVGQLPDVPEALTALPVACIEDLLVEQPDARRDWTVDPDAIVVLLYTSGSTGAPKGAALTNANLIHGARAMGTSCRFGPDSVFGVWIPGYHVSGLFSGIILPLVHGATGIIFSPRAFVEKPARWLTMIDRYRVTATGSPTFAYDLVARAATPEQVAGLDLSSLQVAVIGGEAVRAEVIDAFTDRFVHNGFRAEAFYTMFGLTEAAMISTGSGHGHGADREWIDRDRLKLGVAEPVPSDSPAAKVSIASGFTLPETEVLVVDPDSRAVQADRRVGEIWIGGRAVGAGYWANPAATEAAFGARTADGRGPYLRTGDLGYRADGQIHIVGRLKEMIIIRGLNFYPDDLDATLRRADPRLATARIATFAAEIGGQEELAIAVELPDDTGLATAIRRAVTAAHGIRIGALIHLAPGTIPVTTTGKVQRSRCAQLVANGVWACPEIAAAASGTDEPDFDHAVFADKSPEQRRVEALAVLRRLVAKLTGAPIDAVVEDRALVAFGLDSISSVKLALDLEDRFGMVVPVARLQDDMTLGALADRLAGLSSDAAVVVTDRALPADIVPHPASPAGPETLFLTGATGFLGGYLLHELLTATDAHIACLVRAGDAVSGHARLVAKLEAIGLWEPRFAERIEAIPGDLGQPRFGLDEADFAALGSRLHAIYHNGASVDFVAAYPAIEASNVDAVIDCLRLAVTGSTKPVHFTSTFAVFNGPDRAGLAQIGEGDGLDDPNRLVGGYAQSKWVAESLLRQAGERGIPVGIYRAGFIGGHSGSGYWNQEDFLCRMIKGGIQLGVYPDVAFELPFVAVDDVARTMVALSRLPQAGAATAHMLAPQPLTLVELMEATAAAGHAVEPIPYERWRLILREAMPPENDLFPLLPFLLEPGTDGETVIDLFVRHAQPRWSDALTQARLAGKAVERTAADEAYLRRCLRYFERIGFLAAPTVVSA